MRNLTLCFLLLVTACQKDLPPRQKVLKAFIKYLEDSHRELPQPRRGGLDSILRERSVRFLTSKNNYDYIVQNGQQAGYEYEMAKRFTRYLNKKFGKKGQLPIRFEMLPVPRQYLQVLLEEGYGDIIAAGLGVTEELKKRFSLSHAYNTSDERLITHLPVEDIINMKSLSGRVVAVKKSSRYFESLTKINKELELVGSEPIKIELVDEDFEIETLMELVSIKYYAFTVVDTHLAEMGRQIYKNLKVVPNIRLRQKGQIAWAIRKEDDRLLEEVNKFIPSVKKGSLLGNIHLKRYFKNVSNLKGVNSKQISPYDHLIKKYAKRYQWDWKLLASLCFQESRFDIRAKSHRNAIGLFQVLEQTAKEPYIKIFPIGGKEHIENNIHAGVKYLTWLKERYFSDSNLTTVNSVYFSLAAYNAGPGSVIRARRVAKKLGLDTNTWFGHVELALLKMRNYEPVQYVAGIHRRHLAYSLLVSE